MHQRPAQTQPPQRRGPELRRLRRFLPDAVAGPDVVQQQVGEKRHDLVIEHGVRAGARLQRRHVTGGAADAGEQLLAHTRRLVDGSPPRRGEKFHEGFEIVDAAPARPAIGLILGIGDRVALLHLLFRDPECELLRKQIVGDAHLVAVGVAGEGEQRRLLRLPSSAFVRRRRPGRDVGDDRGATADAVAVAVAGIVERHDRFVGDRFDKPRTKQRDRHAARDDVGLRRNDRLAGVSRNREDLKQRAGRRRELDERPRLVAARSPDLRHHAGAADRRDAVADCAARSVECRAQAVLHRLHLGEIVEAEPELLELAAGDARQRIAR